MAQLERTFRATVRLLIPAMSDQPVDSSFQVPGLMHVFLDEVGETPQQYLLSRYVALKCLSRINGGASQLVTFDELRSLFTNRNFVVTVKPSTCYWSRPYILQLTPSGCAVPSLLEPFRSTGDYESKSEQLDFAQPDSSPRPQDSICSSTSGLLNSPSFCCMQKHSSPMFVAHKSQRRTTETLNFSMDLFD
ncbi:hypothetical protein EG68_04639 [Paragonimus skrjabini miyazakii]|uniref:Uncharacterized protein n=1 Tax=Paragonimus skrjabini miyazakii TaxID=59628 RepID=A0A8S9YXD8_9TREM|nr:hypothetical protein EG68_04639 [Paragonimus skrjabini miyazakii]